MAVLLMAEEDRVDLDAPAARYIDWLRSGDG
jgi:CubicO group peptidase (beta-lactamase class C family)